MKRWKRFRTRLGVLAVVGLLVAVVPAVSVVAQADQAGGQLGIVLDQLSDLLQRLEGELAALDRPAAERLEEGVEEAIEAIEQLIGFLSQPREDLSSDARKARIVELDLRLHRLVRILEEIVESTPKAPGRQSREDVVENVRIRLDSRIIEASFGMSPDEYDQLEAVVYRTAHTLGLRIADLAERIGPEAAFPALSRLVDRLEDLLFRLDGFILRRFPER